MSAVGTEPAPLPEMVSFPAAQHRGEDGGLGPGERADIDVLDAGGVLAGPWRPRARKAVSASGPQHEVEHQAWPVTIEGPGEGFSIGVAVAGEGEGVAARRGGAFEARRAAPGADDAAAPMTRQRRAAWHFARPESRTSR
jgi:hypothetical protein